MTTLSPEERKEKERLYKQAYRLANKEKIRAYNNEYNKRNNQKRRDRENKYRAKLRALGIGRSSEETKKRNAEYMREYRRNMSPEQLADKRRYESERRRKLRVKARIEKENQKRIQMKAWLIENRILLETNAFEIHQRIRKAVPRTLPIDIMDDVISDIFIALYDGEIPTDEIETSVRTYVSRHFENRMWSKTRSFDAVMPGTDRLTLEDIIPSTAFHF